MRWRVVLATTTCSFHLHIITEAAAVASASWMQTDLCCPFFFILIFFFSLMIPSKIDSFLPRGAWKTSLHFARDPAGCCKVVVLKESKPIACDLSRITRSSHHYEPGKLTYVLSISDRHEPLGDALVQFTAISLYWWAAERGICFAITYLSSRGRALPTSTERTVALSNATHTHPGQYSLEVHFLSLSLFFIWLSKQRSAPQMGRVSHLRRGNV